MLVLFRVFHSTFSKISSGQPCQQRRSRHAQSYKTSKLSSKEPSWPSCLTDGPTHVKWVSSKATLKVWLPQGDVVVLCVVDPGVPQGSVLSPPLSQVNIICIQRSPLNLYDLRLLMVASCGGLGWFDCLFRNEQGKSVFILTAKLFLIYWFQSKEHLVLFRRNFSGF